MDDTDIPVTVVGVVIIVILIAFTINSISYYSHIPLLTVSPQGEPSHILLSYRLFDIIFLAFLVFAAISGLAAIFRPEKIGGEE